MVVKDVMSTNLVTVSPEENASVAARLLSRHNIGALPVCTKDGRLKGMLTDRDIVLRCVAANEDPQQLKISDIMTRKVYSVDSQESLEQASALMSAQQVRRLPVQEQGKLVGMVSLGDVAKAPGCRTEAAKALEDISSNLKQI